MLYHRFKGAINGYCAKCGWLVLAHFPHKCSAPTDGSAKP